MKQQNSLLYSLLFAILLAPSCLSMEVYHYLLGNGWQFRNLNTRTAGELSTLKWMPARVPSTVHSELKENGVVKDPFIRMQNDAQLWVASDSWEYTLEFEIQDKEIMKQEIVELVFEGLDTFANVSLNGKLIGRTDNYHRTWVFNVKEVLNEVKETLSVRFDSAVEHNKNEQRKWANLSFPEAFAHSRKPHFQFGWDWAPRLTTCGIFKPVYLRAYSHGRIASTQFRNDDISLTTIDDILPSLRVHGTVEVESVSSTGAYQVEIKVG